MVIPTQLAINCASLLPRMLHAWGSSKNNGNLTKDLDREIELIEYNVLNLPEKVSFANGNEIVNTYDAAGRKLLVRIVTKTAAVHNPLVISDLLPGRKSRPLPDRPFMPDAMEKLDKINTYAYIANMEYDMDKVIVEAGVLDEPGSSYLHAPAASSSVEGAKRLIRMHNPEGYVANNKYYYYRRDHLGNNREVWNASTNTVVQRTQYYPSGLPWQYSSSDGASTQPYKYNSKEFVEAHGLDEYDYGARGMYPAIMRFTTMDPLAEKKPWLTPYHYCSNDPVNRIDPDGRDDYYSQLGVRLGTDNNPDSYQIRIMDEGAWKRLQQAELIIGGVIDPSLGMSIAKLHSESDLSPDASLKIYSHYNPTDLPLLLTTTTTTTTNTDNNATLMSFLANYIEDKALGIKVHVSNLKETGVSDNINEIINVFIHEEKHYLDFKMLGGHIYQNLNNNKLGKSLLESRATSVQIAHPSFNGIGVRTWFKQAIKNHQNKHSMFIATPTTPLLTISNR